MAPNDTKTLHEKGEPRMHGLISMMDIMGPTITCDDCSRWQRLGKLTEDDCRQVARESGWTIKDGRDLCPICSKTKVSKEAMDWASERIAAGDLEAPLALNKDGTPKTLRHLLDEAKPKLAE